MQCGCWLVGNHPCKVCACDFMHEKGIPMLGAVRANACVCVSLHMSNKRATHVGGEVNGSMFVGIDERG